MSEGRKPEEWKPEDQWSVRQPESICGAKLPKPSKSWLSIFKSDCTPPPECDYRLTNCPPQERVYPWYKTLLDKKPSEKPPISTCRREMESQKLAAEAAEERDLGYVPETRPIWPEEEEDICYKAEIMPTPIVGFPLPKGVDPTLKCCRPPCDYRKISPFQRLPYDEFRAPEPEPPFKPEPPRFSLPQKIETLPKNYPTCLAQDETGKFPFAEYKKVDLPKPLYRRFKSVELADVNNLFTMTDARCPPDSSNRGTTLKMQPPRLKKEKKEPVVEYEERPYVAGHTCKPIKLRTCPQFEPFRPKPTKLIETLKFRNPCAQYKKCSLKTVKKEKSICMKKPKTSKPSNNNYKVLTSTMTDEPPLLKRFYPSTRPPGWMYQLSKPGARDTPLVPCTDDYPKEPDWCGETDGLRFYDGVDGNIRPKPGPDPCRTTANEKGGRVIRKPVVEAKKETPRKHIERFVLMPDKYNVKTSRPGSCLPARMKEPKASFQEYLDSQRGAFASCHLPPKEDIMYDIQRVAEVPTTNVVHRPPPPGPCPQVRQFSTSCSNRKNLDDMNSIVEMQCKVKPGCGKKPPTPPPEYTPCKARKLEPKPRDCVPNIKVDIYA